MLRFSWNGILLLKAAELSHILCPFDPIPTYVPGPLCCWQGAPVSSAWDYAFAQPHLAALHELCSTLFWRSHGASESCRGWLSETVLHRVARVLMRVAELLELTAPQAYHDL